MRASLREDGHTTTGLLEACAGGHLEVAAKLLSMQADTEARLAPDQQVVLIGEFLDRAINC